MKRVSYFENVLVNNGFLGHLLQPKALNHLIEAAEIFDEGTAEDRFHQHKKSKQKCQITIFLVHVLSQQVSTFQSSFAVQVCLHVIPKIGRLIIYAITGQARFHRVCQLVVPDGMVEHQNA